MNLFVHFRALVLASINELSERGLLPADLDLGDVGVEPSRDPGHGDLACNAALVLAGQARMKPRLIAEPLARALGMRPEVDAAEVAGPGFINLRLTDAFWRARLADVLAAGTDYGASTLGAGRRINVEYVSANPTGPLHIGHCRGAAVGDALAALLEKAGYEVAREYYINDAGAQLDALARSVHLRYREALGEKLGAIPEGLYPGDYLIPVGQALADRDGDKWLSKSETDWLEDCAEFGRGAMMKLIRDDLALLGVQIDHFTSERALHRAGRVDEALDRLGGKGLVYQGQLERPKGKEPGDWEPRLQVLFRSTQFGDDVDRPLKKSDGSWTYFAADIANHLDKIERGFDSLIDVWGADHAGYVKRMKAAVSALTDGGIDLDIKLCQLVKLSRRGEPVKMSKRAGSFVTLREVVDGVGKDVVRFIMLTRKNEAPLDFDFARVSEQSKDNPVFYVQYAHARGRSVLRKAARLLPELALDKAALGAADLDRLTHPDEIGLIKTLAAWPRVVEAAAEAHEPHRVAFYLHDLASEFHVLWNRGNEDPGLRFLIAEDPALSAARLALVQGVLTVVASGLGIIGVEPVEEML